MQEYLEDGDAGWVAQINAVIQASTRTAYHVSGGKITPGSSATSLTVAVEAGEANVNDTNVEWAGEELTLEPGGVGPSGQDTGLPRVDAIFARQDSALGVATGDPAAYAPDTTDDGQSFTPAPFEHWTPAPDSGSRIGGLLLGFVIVEPADTSANDIPDTRIKQWKIGASLESSKLVFGDGSENGPTTIAVNGDPITIQDEALTNGQIADYDPANTLLELGGPEVRVEMQSLGELTVDSGGVGTILDTKPDPNGVVNVWETAFEGSDTWAAQLGLGTPDGDPYTIINLATGNKHFAIERNGDTNIQGNPLKGVNQIQFDSNAALFDRDADGHLVYTAPDGTIVDLTAGQGDIS